MDESTDETSSDLPSDQTDQQWVPSEPPPEPATPQIAIKPDISPSNPMIFVDPRTGKSYKAKNEQGAQDAIDLGWRTENKQEFAQRQVADVVKDYPIMGRIATGASAFVNQATLGIFKPIEEAIGGPTIAETNRALEKEYSGTNIAGGLAGVSYALLRAPIGAALDTFGDAAAQGIANASAVGGQAAAKIASSALGKAAIKYGTENVAFNAPYRVTEQILGDPDVAGQGIVGGAVSDFGVGASLGLGTSLVAPAIKGAAGLAKGALPKFLETQADIAQLKNAGLLTSDLKKVPTVMGEPLWDSIPAATKFLDKEVGKGQIGGAERINQALHSNLNAAEQKLSFIRKEVDGLAPEGVLGYQQVSQGYDDLAKEYTKGNISFTNATPQIGTQAAANRALQLYGGDPSKWPKEITQAVLDGRDLPPIGGALTDIANQNAGPNLKAINYAKEQWRYFASQEMLAKGMNEQQIAEAFMNQTVPNFTLEQGHAYRQSIKDRLFNPDQLVGFKSDGGTAAWNSLSDYMDGMATKIAKDSGRSDLVNSFKPANMHYRRLLQWTQYLSDPATIRAMSRNKIGLGTLIATTIGEGLGGVGGGLTGAALGYAKQRFGNFAMYQTLGLASKALDAVNGKIGNAVQQAIASPYTGKAIMGSVGLLSRYSGESDQPKAFQAIQNDLALASQSPDSLAQSLSYVAPNLAEFAPQTYASAATTTQAAMKYLQDIAPKPPEPLYAGGPSRPWEPSDNELSRYARAMNAVFSPLSILDEIKTGTLTKESVDAVQAVYPKFYQAVQTEVMKRLVKASPAQVYAIRNKLSLILPSSINPQALASQVQALQSGFAPAQKAQPRANSKITQSARMTSDINRVLND